MNSLKPDIRSVLIITYYWPPSGGGGVQRWLSFTRHLPSFGWRPLILTPSNPSVREQDHSLLNQIHPDLKVVKIPINEPYRIVSRLFKTQTIPKQGIVENDKGWKHTILTWMRGNLLIPDTRIFWRKPAFKKAAQIIREESIDLVITTGPPHSMHLIGYDLKKKLNVKWIADFRDPWSEWDILDQLKLTNRVRNIHRKLEKKVIRSADGFLTVSHAWGQEFSRLYGKSPEIITNGYEEERQASPGKTTEDKFRISHFGLINQFRNAPALWKVLSGMCHENKNFAADLELFFAGNVDERVFAALKNYGLDDKITHVSYIAYQELPQKYQQTSVFLLLTNKSKNASGHVPGKLFEYLIQGKPILALAEPEGDVARILENTNTGLVADPDDERMIRACLFQLYDGFVNKKNLFSPVNTHLYARRNLTESLSAYMNRIIH